MVGCRGCGRDTEKVIFEERPRNWLAFQEIGWNFWGRDFQAERS